MRFCARCFNVTDDRAVPVLHRRPPRRRVVCVVEESRDIVAVERTGEFHGRYHVLLGAMSPLEGIGPEQLKIRELLARIEPEGIEEIIICTNPNTEGEVTAMYLARQLRPLGLRVTRLASGLPVGGDLEYADELTLGRALEGRREVTTPTAEAPGRRRRQVPAGAPPRESVAGGRADSSRWCPEKESVTGGSPTLTAAFQPSQSRAQRRIVGLRSATGDSRLGTTTPSSMPVRPVTERSPTCQA